MKKTIRLIPLIVLFASAAAGDSLAIPTVILTNQHGESVNTSELTGGGVVIVNFIFTNCETICPPMGANFGRLQALLDQRGETRIRLVSISVDPTTDTPARLDKWAGQFHANSRWTLLTGQPTDIHKVLRAFGVYSPDKFTHTSVAVILNAKGESTRSDGLKRPEELLQAALQLLPGAQARATPRTIPAADQQAAAKPAQHYFSDTVLLDQNGVPHRFYSDLLKDKVVIINVMFTTCKSSCPMLTATFARLQDWLGSRLNTDVNMISITVDPLTDTPQKLKVFAAGYKARPGWYFLTGTKANVDRVLTKLGQYVEVKEDHQNIFLIGNDHTGLWKKAFGMAPTDKIIDTVDSVLRDAK